MDIVSHGITGVLVSRALPSGDKGFLMAAAIIGGLAPDLDVIAGLWDPMAAITVHRTVTHSKGSTINWSPISSKCGDPLIGIALGQGN